MKRNHLNTFLRYYTKAFLQFCINEAILWWSSEITLVYTMAKVGSTSYYKVLKKYPWSPVFHIHSLNLSEEHQYNQALKTKGLYPDSWSNTNSILRHLRQGKKTKVITAIRNPFQRNISAFFEVLEYYTDRRGEQMSTQELTQIFLEKLPHDYPLDWFDKEINNYLGINVYQYPFDTSKKYQRINKGPISLLLLRTDTPDTVKVAQITDFSKKSIDAFSKQNIATDKYYAQAYERFKRTVRLPHTYIQKLTEHSFTRHFFHLKEIVAMRNRWSKENK